VLLNGSYPDFLVLGSACNFRITPKADWNGRQRFNITVRDEVTTRWLDSWFNVSVEPVNDAPRLQSGAHAAYDVVTLAEDSETTVGLRSIFYDVDDAALDFRRAASRGRMSAFFINNISQIATITPSPTGTASPPSRGRRRRRAPHQPVCHVDRRDRRQRRAARERPAARPHRVQRRGRSHRRPLRRVLRPRRGPLEYYGYIEDPNVAQHVRINNSNLLPSDPHMRIYVLDRDRADYYSDGPVQIKFGVRDPATTSTLRRART